MEHKETAKFQVGTDPVVELDTSGPGWENFRRLRAERIEAERVARLARIDETARAIFAAQFEREPDLHACYPTTGLDRSRLPDDCAAAYRFALALERARDEAVKEVK